MATILKSGLRHIKGQVRCKLDDMPYTRDELVAMATAKGFNEVSARLVTDWVAKGLLGDAKRVPRGRGAGKGARFEWSEEQLALFLTILQERPRYKSVVVLTAIPVEVWLYWGERWVELPQVRRALLTWWGRTQRSGWDSSLAVARKVVNDICPPGTPRAVKTDLRELIASMVEAKHYPLNVLINAVSTARSFGPESGLIGQLGTPPELLARGMLSMVIAREHWDELSDEMFFDARNRLGMSLLQFAHWQKMSDMSSDVPKPPQRVSREFFISEAPKHLLMDLGMQIMARDVGDPIGKAPDVPPIFQTDLYQELPVR